MRYRYVGGMAAVQVYVDGIEYEVARGELLDIPSNVLDNHPEFEKIEEN